MSSKKKQQKGPGCLSYIIVIMIIYALISSFVDTYHSEILKFTGQLMKIVKLLINISIAIIICYFVIKLFYKVYIRKKKTKENDLMTSSVPVNVPVIPVQEEAPNKKVEDTIDCSVNTSSALVEKTDVDTFYQPAEEHDHISNSTADPYFEEAGYLVTERQIASVGYLQRKFGIGFNRANKLLEQLHIAAIVGPESGTKPRKVWISKELFEKAIKKGSYDSIDFVLEAEELKSRDYIDSDLNLPNHFENAQTRDGIEKNTFLPYNASIDPTVERIKFYNNKFDYMEGTDFEQYCAMILRENGYTTEITPASGDYGIDIIAKQSGIIYAIQCKCYSSDVGVDAVYQVAGGMKYYHANIGIVLTNRHFTRNAKELADAIGVVLWDRESLEDLIASANIDTTPSDNVELESLEQPSTTDSKDSAEVDSNESSVINPYNESDGK